MKMSHLFYLGIGWLLIASSCLAYQANLSFQKPTQQKIAKYLVIEKDKLFDPDVLTLDSLPMYSDAFTLNWDNLASIIANKDKIDEIKNFLKNTSEAELNQLTPEYKNALGTMLQKLGGYYVNYTHQPDLAIQYLQIAQSLFHGKHKMNDLAWNDGYFAFAYEQKFEATGDEKDKDKANDYADKVIALYHNHPQHKALAFAYCIKGLIANEERNYSTAELAFTNAINIYEKISNPFDPQVIRAKNKLASIKIDGQGPNDDTLNTLLDIKQFWFSQKNVMQNPYAARNLLSLGHAYLKTGQITQAREQFEKVIAIYTRIYGTDTELLVKPYQLLSDTYTILGLGNLAETFQIKSNLLDKSEN